MVEGLLALLLAGADDAAPRTDTLAALGRALTACWHAPAGSAGADLTVLLSLTREGAVLGKPRITHARLVGSDDQRTAFVAAALGSLAQCTPVAITPALGGAIAGRPFTIRFVGGEPARPV